MFPNSATLGKLLEQIKGDFSKNTEKAFELNNGNINLNRPKSGNLIKKKNQSMSNFNSNNNNNINSNFEIYNQNFKKTFNTSINQNSSRINYDFPVASKKNKKNNLDDSNSNFNLNSYKFSPKEINFEDFFAKKNEDANEKYLKGDKINEEKLINDYRLSLNKELLRRLFEEREKENLRENLLRTTMDLNEKKNLEKRFVNERVQSSSEIIMINE